MSIQDLGSIGELVAAIATILTLLYLAAQIKTNTKIALAENIRESINTPIEHSLLPAQDPEFAEILRRGLTDFSSLSGVEKLRFHQWMYPLFAHVETVWRMNRMDLMEKGPYEGWLKSGIALISTEGGREWCVVVQ